MSELTHVFTLPSGVECEVNEITGKEQRLLTEQNGKSFSDKLNDVLERVIKRLGSKQVISAEDVKDLLSEDRKCILWNARMFSLDEDTFAFKYNYIDKDNKEQTLIMNVDLTDQLPVKPYACQWTELEDIKKEVSIVLPRSGKSVTFKLLDGHGEAAGSKTKKSELSSHTPLKMRCPVTYVATNEGKSQTPIQLDLDSLSLKDIEGLRSAIYEAEGKFHTEMSFAHPEAEFKPHNEKMVTVDLLGEMAFFFPSGRI